MKIFRKKIIINFRKSRQKLLIVSIFGLSLCLGIAVVLHSKNSSTVEDIHQNRGLVSKVFADNSYYNLEEKERKPINLNFVNSNRSDEKTGEKIDLEIVDNNYRTFVKNNSTAKNLITLEKLISIEDGYGSVRLSYGLQDNKDLGKIHKSRGIVTGNTVLFQDVFQGVSVQYSIFTDKMSEKFIISDINTARKLSKLSS